MKLINIVVGSGLALALTACSNPSSGGSGGAIGHRYVWTAAGAPNFASFNPPSLAVGTDGLYAAYVDKNIQKTTVQKFNGSTWSVVGNAGIGSATVSTSMAVDSNGTPYVVYRDSGNSNKASALRFTGQAWEQAGAQGFSSEVGNSLTLVRGAAGTMYCAFTDPGDNSVQLYSLSGGTWSSIKPADRFDNLTFLQKNSLATDSDGNLYIALQSYGALDANGTGIQVFRYVSGTNWQMVGGAFAPTTGISNDQVTIAVAKNKPYVAYIENPETNHQVSVMHFDGNDWKLVGAARFSPDSSYDPTIAIDSTGAPYVTCEPGLGDGQAVFRFDGTSWVPSAANSIVSTGAVDLDFGCSFVVGTADSLYVSYMDDPDGDQNTDAIPTVMMGTAQ